MYFTFNGEDTPCRLRTKRYCIRTFLLLAAERQGCYAALTIREQSDYSIVIAEKANIKRSGCLAVPVSMPLMLTLWMEENRKIMWSTQKRCGRHCKRRFADDDVRRIKPCDT